MNQPTLFENEEFGMIRGIEINGEAWVVAKDVARALGYANPRKAVADHVDDEDKQDWGPIRDSMGREKNPTFINESGCYALIFGSKLPAARKFKRWVTHDVLPTLRRTGHYELPENTVQANYQFPITISTAAHILGVGRNKFSKFLCQQGYLTYQVVDAKGSKKQVPTVAYIDSPLFSQTFYKSKRGYILPNLTLITEAGLNHFKTIISSPELITAEVIA